MEMKLLLHLILAIKAFKCDEVISTVVLFRHGERTPLGFVKNDPYRNESFWPDGLGELTNTGIQQEYDLGKWLRTKYDTFLPRKYSKKDIYIRSTDEDRTLTSAAALLAGLYPPEGAQIWNKKIPWRPIPIHTVPHTNDYLLGFQQCPKHSRLIHDMEKSEKFTETISDFPKLVEFLTKHCGQDMSSLDAITLLTNGLFIEDLYNYTLPTWTKGIYPDKLYPLAVIGFSRQTYTPELARLKVGPFFCELIQHLQTFTSSKINYRIEAPWGRKVTLFSAHDIVLVDILNSLGIWNRKLPPYASTLIFELWKGKNKVQYINLLYRTSSKGVVKLTVPGCEENCEFGQFVELITPMSMCYKDWVKECNQNNFKVNGGKEGIKEELIELGGKVLLQKFDEQKWK